MRKPLVIIGAGEFAMIANQYFTNDSDFDVRAFCVESAYLKESSLEGHPIEAYEEIEARFPPGQFHVFVAIPASQLNRLRRRFYEDLKHKGYQFATYISSRAFVWPNAKIGENTFIFENNVIQPYVVVGDNCILWSGNHIGHRTVIRNHVFIASHAVISGYCEIGESCFIGVNSTFNDYVKVGESAVIGSGALIARDVEPGKVYVGTTARAVPNKSSLDVDL
jgi:sugar O-acyltransferase (sialic acid O-acetyltransferase NeuD family)